MSQKTLAALHARLARLAVKTSPLAVPPPRDTRFGGRLALSRVHWVRPVLVAEIIEHFAVKYRADLACDGPMAAATQALAERVKAGERIVCLCWCWPKPCHGTLIIDEINRRLE